MAKKKKKSSKKVSKKKDADSTKRGPRKGTRIAFLRELYIDNPEISNEKALSKLLAKFPESNANTKAIITWKKMLRDEGIEIPLQRSGAKPKAGDDAGKKAKKKSKKKSKK